jgi:hypothetical protein
MALPVVFVCMCVPRERIIIVIQMAGFEYNAHCSRRAPGNILRAEYKILRAAAARHRCQN